MTLYELTGEFRYLFEQFDEIDLWEPEYDELGNALNLDGEIIPDVVVYKEKMRTAWFDTLTALEAEFDEKAESCAVYIKNLTAEAKAIKDEEKALKSRRQLLERRAESVTRYLMRSMKAVGKTKISSPRAELNIKKNPESIVVDDEIGFIKWAQSNNDSLLKYAMPEIRKTEAKTLLKNGASLPFCHLERKEVLKIK